ncbi:exported hypothetical protein [Candidatus Sulfopaludibacter sp. SbA4]|nr:exported hypothetical protein [Candidatus Sulfopaludibacter sp. SbA4]
MKRRTKLASIALFGVMSTATLAADLSRYRDFQLGTDLPAVARQAGVDPKEAKVVHSRPALIQELSWRPQPLGASSKTEPAREVLFTFCDGALFRIAIDYDRYQTEGMTTDDLVEAISVSYGIAVKPPAPPQAGPRVFGQEEAVARWQDSEYSFELLRSSNGPTFKLVGIVKKLDAQAQAAIVEAARLDDKEAPQREANRLAREDETERAKLDKARLVNRARFRP